MKWERLKNMKCPKCNRLLFRNDNKQAVVCVDEEGVVCFAISYTKFDSVVSGLYERKPRVPTDNASDWNNYGHELVADDYGGNREEN